MRDRARAIEISPSILSADFARFGEEAKRLEEAAADAIHVDIMDGHFVPNLTMGPKVVAALRRSCNLFLDVHLMIYRPFEFIEEFVSAGANRITFHLEATEDVAETIAFIKRCHIEAGLALSPMTDVSFALPYLDQIDLLLLMSVEPGFSGQSFIPGTLDKLMALREMVDESRWNRLFIQVDGGINDVTAPLCAKCGALSFVSGSYLYRQNNLAAGIQLFREELERVLAELS